MKIKTKIAHLVRTCTIIKFVFVLGSWIHKRIVCTFRKMANESSNVSDQNAANVEPMNDASTSRSIQNQIDLLDNAQAIIRLEKLLTETLAKVEPWLPQSQNQSNNNNNRHRSNPNMIRVRPIPRNMEEAHHILAMARNLAARTSAPAGWNPNAPVVGFSTPSPLPNQLRSGSLATLQLERAKQIQKYEREKKKRQQEQLQQQQQQMQKKLKSTNTNNDVTMKTDDDLQEQDPKRRDILSHEEQLQLDQARIAAAQRNVTFQQSQQPRKTKQDVSMNLSDDSDSDDDDDDSD